ncbi:hypothetical protein [Parapedobacter koreensis]|uniref:Anti-sigma factor n=1 Tax=Parapedobacter koreensis TaxID=332977 RepID=A0A1H7NVY9_9SPHI|nr:hypothetical protein [Parapedobacter koreensis]SEL27469.1 hypothetical protein SAMN05421740_104116 [Parapedobacter koreensis]
MKKDLKTFIAENKAAFDDANPPADLWQRIASNLDQQEQSRHDSPMTGKPWVIQVLKVAAITFLIGTAGIVIYFYGRKHAYDDYSQVNPHLAAEQQVYARLVTQKKDSIAYIATSDPALYGEFSKVLHQMEANYEMLKQEFVKSPNKELTLEAMIRNLQAQIEVLSQQMEILNYINNTKNQTKNEQI